LHIVLVSAQFIYCQPMVPYFPLGLLTLHKILYDAGHDCRIYVPHKEGVDKAEPETLINQWAAEIVATKPDCVGFSTMCGSYPLILLLAKKVKRFLPQTCIVLGGPQASVVAEKSVAAFPWIDYIIRGEAEPVILDFVNVIAEKKKPHETPNLTYRTNGKILSTPLGPLLNDLDSLALPDYQAYPHFEEALFPGEYGIEEKFIPLEAGRGCPYRCCFCSTSSFWLRRRRQKSPDLLVEQIKSVSHKYNIRTIVLMQDLFAVEGNWLTDFLRAMGTNSRVNWTCSLRPDGIKTETLSDMKRAGCTGIFFGIESGSQRSQKLIGKNLDISKTQRTVEAAVANGISVKTSFIVGFPWETGEDLQETLSLHEHFLAIGVDTSEVHLLSPLPLTQIAIRYSTQLRIDHVTSKISRGLGNIRTVEIDRMIRQYPQIFSSFYYLKPEFLSRQEILLAAEAANALPALERTVQS